MKSYCFFTEYRNDFKVVTQELRYFDGRFAKNLNINFLLIVAMFGRKRILFQIFRSFPFTNSALFKKSKLNRFLTILLHSCSLLVNSKTFATFWQPAAPLPSLPAELDSQLSIGTIDFVTRLPTPKRRRRIFACFSVPRILQKSTGKQNGVSHF